MVDFYGRSRAIDAKLDRASSDAGLTVAALGVIDLHDGRFDINFIHYIHESRVRIKALSVNQIFMSCIMKSVVDAQVRK
jgi:hypothetical protein